MKRKLIIALLTALLLLALLPAAVFSLCPKSGYTPNELRSNLRAIIFDYLSNPSSSVYTKNEILDLLKFYESEKTKASIADCDVTVESSLSNTEVSALLEKTIEFQGQSPETPPSSLESKPTRKVFVTSKSYSGNLGGLLEADKKCQEAVKSNPYEMPQNALWKAWLSTSYISAKNRIPDAKFIRPDGAVIADSLADLTDGTIQNPINLDEYGFDFSEYVWTGTKADGLASGASACKEWTSSDNSYAGTVGRSSDVNSFWTMQSQNPERFCASASHLYCFEVPQPLSLIANPPSIMADGISTLTVTAATPDSKSNVVISFSSSRAEDAFSSLTCTTGNDGKCSVTIKSTKSGASIITGSETSYGSSSIEVTFTPTAGQYEKPHIQPFLIIPSDMASYYYAQEAVLQSKLNGAFDEIEKWYMDRLPGKNMDIRLYKPIFSPYSRAWHECRSVIKENGVECYPYDAPRQNGVTAIRQKEGLNINYWDNTPCDRKFILLFYRHSPGYAGANAFQNPRDCASVDGKTIIKTSGGYAGIGSAAIYSILNDAASIEDCYKDYEQDGRNRADFPANNCPFRSAGMFTIAHELGHTLGIFDYCHSDPPWDTVIRDDVGVAIGLMHPFESDLERAEKNCLLTYKPYQQLYQDNSIMGAGHRTYPYTPDTGLNTWEKAALMRDPFLDCSDCPSNSILSMKGIQNAISFHENGNAVLRGAISTNANPAPTSSDEFILKGSSGNPVAIINLATGNMAIKGKLFEKQALLTPSGTSNDFVASALPEASLAWDKDRTDVKYGFFDSAADSNGNLYVGGGNLEKYDPRGNFQWSVKRKGSVGSNALWDVIIALAVDSSDNIIVAAIGRSGTDTSIIIEKYGSTGNLVWTTTLNPTPKGEEPKDIAIDSQNNVYVVGITNAGAPGGWRWYTAKLSSSGSKLWSDTYDPTTTCSYGGALCPSDALEGVAIDSNDNAVVVGWAGIEDSNVGAIRKYSPNGNVLWTVQTAQKGFSQIKIDSAGNLYIFQSRMAIPKVLKYKPDGTFIGVVVEDLRGNGFVENVGIYFDLAQNGDIYVAGRKGDIPTGVSYANTPIPNTQWQIAAYNPLGVLLQGFPIVEDITSKVDIPRSIMIKNNLFVVGYVGDDRRDSGYGHIKVYATKAAVPSTAVLSTFGVKDSSGNVVSYIDDSGNFYLKGSLLQNGNP